MTIFGASKTFESEASERRKKTRRPVVSATSATASVAARDRSFKGLFRPLCISSEYPQQKLGTLRGAPKNKLLRKVIKAPAKTSALRHRHTNIKSQYLQKVEVTEYWLCHRHTKATPILWRRSSSVSNTWKPYAVTLGCTDGRWSCDDEV